MSSDSCEFFGHFGHVIIIKRDGSDQARCTVTKRAFVFGKDENCDIRVLLEAVADQHCLLKIEVDGKAYLEPVKKSNLTLVNGSKIDCSWPINHKDIFTVVERNFRFEYPEHSFHCHLPVTVTTAHGNGLPETLQDVAVNVLTVASKICSGKKSRSSRLSIEARKQKKVSFGPALSPEQFDKNMPPSSPLKRGSIPRRFPVALRRQSFQVGHPSFMQVTSNSVVDKSLHAESSQDKSEYDVMHEQSVDKIYNEPSKLRCRNGVSDLANENVTQNSDFRVHTRSSSSANDSHFSGIESSQILLRRSGSSNKTENLPKLSLGNGKVLSTSSENCKSVSSAADFKDISSEMTCNMICKVQHNGNVDLSRQFEESASFITKENHSSLSDTPQSERDLTSAMSVWENKTLLRSSRSSDSRRSNISPRKSDNNLKHSPGIVSSIDNVRKSDLKRKDALKNDFQDRVSLIKPLGNRSVPKSNTKVQNKCLLVNTSAPPHKRAELLDKRRTRSFSVSSRVLRLSTTQKNPNLSLQKKKTSPVYKKLRRKGVEMTSSPIRSKKHVSCIQGDSDLINFSTPSVSAEIFVSPVSDCMSYINDSKMKSGSSKRNSSEVKMKFQREGKHDSIMKEHREYIEKKGNGSDNNVQVKDSENFKAFNRDCINCTIPSTLKSRKVEGKRKRRYTSHMQNTSDAAACSIISSPRKLRSHSLSFENDVSSVIHNKSIKKVNCQFPKRELEGSTHHGKNFSSCKRFRSTMKERSVSQHKHSLSPQIKNFHSSFPSTSQGVTYFPRHKSLNRRKNSVKKMLFSYGSKTRFHHQLEKSKKTACLKSPNAELHNSSRDTDNFHFQNGKDTLEWPSVHCTRNQSIAKTSLPNSSKKNSSISLKKASARNSNQSDVNLSENTRLAVMDTDRSSLEISEMIDPSDVLRFSSVIHTSTPKVMNKKIFNDFNQLKKGNDIDSLDLLASSVSGKEKSSITRQNQSSEDASKTSKSSFNLDKDDFHHLSSTESSEVSENLSTSDCVLPKDSSCWKDVCGDGIAKRSTRSQTKLSNDMNAHMSIQRWQNDSDRVVSPKTTRNSSVFKISSLDQQSKSAQQCFSPNFSLCSKKSVMKRIEKGTQVLSPEEKTPVTRSSMTNKKKSSRSSHVSNKASSKSFEFSHKSAPELKQTPETVEISIESGAENNRTSISNLRSTSFDRYVSFTDIQGSGKSSPALNKTPASAMPFSPQMNSLPQSSKSSDFSSLNSPGKINSKQWKVFLICKSPSPVKCSSSDISADINKELAVEAELDISSHSRKNLVIGKPKRSLNYLKKSGVHCPKRRKLKSVPCRKKPKHGRRFSKTSFMSLGESCANSLIDDSSFDVPVFVGKPLKDYSSSNRKSVANSVHGGMGVDTLQIRGLKSKEQELCLEQKFTRRKCQSSCVSPSSNIVQIVPNHSSAKYCDLSSLSVGMGGKRQTDSLDANYLRLSDSQVHSHSVLHEYKLRRASAPKAKTERSRRMSKTLSNPKLKPQIENKSKNAKVVSKCLSAHISSGNHTRAQSDMPIENLNTYPLTKIQTNDFKKKTLPPESEISQFSTIQTKNILSPGKVKSSKIMLRSPIQLRSLRTKKAKCLFSSEKEVTENKRTLRKRVTSSTAQNSKLSEGRKSKLNKESVRLLRSPIQLRSLRNRKEISYSHFKKSSSSVKVKKQKKKSEKMNLPESKVSYPAAQNEKMLKTMKSKRSAKKLPESEVSYPAAQNEKMLKTMKSKRSAKKLESQKNVRNTQTRRENCVSSLSVTVEHKKSRKITKMLPKSKVLLYPAQDEEMTKTGKIGISVRNLRSGKEKKSSKKQKVSSKNKVSSYLGSEKEMHFPGKLRNSLKISRSHVQLRNLRVRKENSGKRLESSHTYGEKKITRGAKRSTKPKLISKRYRVAHMQRERAGGKEQRKSSTKRSLDVNVGASRDSSSKKQYIRRTAVKKSDRGAMKCELASSRNHSKHLPLYSEAMKSQKTNLSRPSSVKSSVMLKSSCLKELKRTRNIKVKEKQNTARKSLCIPTKSSDGKNNLQKMKRNLLKTQETKSQSSKKLQRKKQLKRLSTSISVREKQKTLPKKHASRGRNRECSLKMKQNKVNNVKVSKKSASTSIKLRNEPCPGKPTIGSQAKSKQFQKLTPLKRSHRMDKKKISGRKKSIKGSPGKKIIQSARKKNN